MRLTRTERWMLSNQYRILEALCPKEADRLSEEREALENGYEIEYAHACSHISEDVLTSEECRQVLDILTMFRALKLAYEGLSDKSGIEDWAVEFRGFDGNDETKYVAYARYYCRSRGGRFPELGTGDDFNSHAPTLDEYLHMLNEWKRSGNKHKLTREDLVRITKAWRNHDTEQ